jgi:hypothetical protein
MRKHKIRWVYLKEKLIPPRFKRVSFQELEQLYKERKVKLTFVDPKFYLAHRILEKLLRIPLIRKFSHYFLILILKKSKSIVVTWG